MGQSPADAVRVGWQVAEDTNCWVFGCSHMDFFERDELWFHENVLVGNSPFDHQKDEQTRYQIGYVNSHPANLFEFEFLVQGQLKLILFIWS